MPDLVRLPAEVPDGEVRVYWDETDDGRCLHVWGPPSCRAAVLDLVAGKRLAIRDEASFAARMELYGGVLEQAPSLADTLQALGYDPRTFVLSVRRKGMPAPPVAVPDDVRGRLEEATAALKALERALGAREEAKGVHVFDDGEMDDVMEAFHVAEAAVAHAAALANGTTTPEREAQA